MTCAPGPGLRRPQGAFHFVPLEGLPRVLCLLRLRAEALPPRGRLTRVLPVAPGWVAPAFLADLSCTWGTRGFSPALALMSTVFFPAVCCEPPSGCQVCSFPLLFGDLVLSAAGRCLQSRGEELLPAFHPALSGFAPASEAISPLGSVWASKARCGAGGFRGCAHVGVAPAPPQGGLFLSLLVASAEVTRVRLSHPRCPGVLRAQHRQRRLEL